MLQVRRVSDSRVADVGDVLDRQEESGFASSNREQAFSSSKILTLIAGIFLFWIGEPRSRGDRFGPGRSLGCFAHVPLQSHRRESRLDPLAHPRVVALELGLPPRPGPLAQFRFQIFELGAQVLELFRGVVQLFEQLLVGLGTTFFIGIRRLFAFLEDIAQIGLASLDSVAKVDKKIQRNLRLLAMAAVGGVYLALPRELVIGPTWLLPSVIAVLLAPTIVTHRMGRHSFNHVLIPIAKQLSIWSGSGDPQTAVAVWKA